MMLKEKFRIIFLIAFSATTGQAQNPDGRFDFSDAKNMILDQVATNQVPSISIAVVYNDKIIWEEAFGLADRERNVKASVHTPYAVASVTKTITATAIMKLAEAGKLDLNGSVNTYLGNAKLTSPVWNADHATIRMLLNHRSGLTSFDRGCGLGTRRCVPVDTIIKRYGIIFRKPGEQEDYSNLGYGILGEVISRVSGRSLQDYFQQEIFKPLGMENSFINNGRPKDNRAIGYYGGPGSARVDDAVISDAPAASSAYSSVHDLARFAMLHLKVRGTVPPHVLSGPTVRHMQEHATNTPYALGWRVNDDFYGYTGVLSQGGTSQANAWIQMIPSEGLAVIVLTNTGRTNCVGIIRSTLAAVLPAFKTDPSKSAKQEINNKNGFTMPDLLPGEWKGVLRTYKGEVPLVLSIQGSGKATVQVAETGTSVDVKILADNSISFRAPGNLNIPDETGENAYEVIFYLFLKDGVLYGSAETRGPNTPILPFWVHLEKMS